VTFDFGMAFDFGETTTPNQKGQRWPRSLQNHKESVKYPQPSRLSKQFGGSRLWVLATPEGSAFSIGWRNNTTPTESLSKSEGILALLLWR
jgi:hypothetical protein